MLTAAIQSQAEQPPSPTPQPASPQPATHTPATSPPPIYSTAKPAAVSPTATRQAAAPESAPTQVAIPSSYEEPPHRKGKLVQVTGVRHWSTSIYTRVAIDLGDEVQYEAARVPDPDRIFFDLHGTRLSPELIGKSVSVIDDGFLKRIRIAQFSNDVTRVVLDVSDVSDYSAFLVAESLSADHRHSRTQTGGRIQSANSPGTGHKQSGCVCFEVAAKQHCGFLDTRNCKAAARASTSDATNCHSCGYKSNTIFNGCQRHAGYRGSEPST